eukprot:1219961-Prymnesium_polylepis.1
MRPRSCEVAFARPVRSMDNAMHQTRATTGVAAYLSRLNRPRDLIHEMAAWRSPAARLRGLQRLQRLQRRRHTIAVSTAKGSCAGRAGHQAIRPAPLPARSCCQPFGYRQPREPQPSDRRSTRSHRAA